MEAFNQTLTQPAAVKEEVSDAASLVCDHTDDESSNSSPSCGEKREGDELDSETSLLNGSVLPPRKRAKTLEEKEQRRVERVMRNRQAAHASREKKRKHLETLEVRCTELESENGQLRLSSQRCEDLQARVEHLEAVIAFVRSSGDISALERISTGGTTPSASTITPAPWAPDVKQEPTTPFYSGNGSARLSPSKDSAGSPAPSLEDDCASPEALFFQRGSEDVSSSLGPQSPTNFLSNLEQDPFDSNYSLESSIFASTDNLANPESSSKSRHPAVVTPSNPRVGNVLH